VIQQQSQNRALQSSDRPKLDQNIPSCVVHNIQWVPFIETRSIVLHCVDVVELLLILLRMLRMLLLMVLLAAAKKGAAQAGQLSHHLDEPTTALLALEPCPPCTTVAFV
jgi:hypothetical protein